MSANEVVLGLITVVGAVLTAFVIPLIKKYIVPFLDSKLSASQMDALNSLAELAIRYYETNIKQAGSGAQKKERVLHYLGSQGYDITDELSMIIDAKVSQLNNMNWK